MPEFKDLPRERRLDIASRMLADPVNAHEVIFQSVHPYKSASCHHDMVRSYHSDEPNVVHLCFRGSAKSTKLEEALAIMAPAGRVKNALIVGASQPKAMERLHTIKWHLNNNEYLKYMFGEKGEIRGETWQAARIEFRSQSVIWAIGQGQDIRGSKTGIERPDYLAVDDLEDEESVATDMQREKLSSWYWKDLVYALQEPGHRRIRILATPLHPKALAVELSKHPAYRHVFIPIEYVDSDGVRCSSWPDKFPLDIIDQMHKDAVDAGREREWAMEMMCQAVDPAIQMFKTDMLHFDPTMFHSWEPVFVAYDPARTDKSTSATTGIVAASFMGRKLIIWRADGLRILPDAVVDDVFKMEDKYHPVKIGIETNGLEQFIEQPLRQEQLNRGQLLPIEPLRAPKGKLDFIGRLQPLFAAGDVVFAGQEKDFTDAKTQILSFPLGAKDILNAMAYLPQLRSGQPVYGDTSSRHMHPGELRAAGAFTLGAHAGAYGTAAVLFQYVNGILMVRKDWMTDAMPGDCLGHIIEEAQLETGKIPSVVIPPYHFDVRNSFGLLAACRGVAAARKGGDVVRGREFIRELLRGEVRASPRLLFGEDASWCRRAFSAGYVWDTGGHEPKVGLYATLCGALEAALATASYSSASEKQRTAHTADGRVYQTSEVKWH